MIYLITNIDITLGFQRVGKNYSIFS